MTDRMAESGKEMTDITPEQRTIEQRAWQIIHEFGPRWWNEYFTRYPNSKVTERTKREEMAHYCVVAALGGDPHV
jgi:hypothetical protein